MKREFALGIRSVSSILSREVVYASLFIPGHRGMSETRSRGGFSIGVYHTGQPPMLDVKGKGGSPSIWRQEQMNG